MGVTAGTPGGGLLLASTIIDAVLVPRVFIAISNSYVRYHLPISSVLTRRSTALAMMRGPDARCAASSSWAERRRPWSWYCRRGS